MNHTHVVPARRSNDASHNQIVRQAKREIHLALPFLFSIPLLVEALRKYVVPNQAVLALGEAALLAAAAIFFIGRPNGAGVRVIAWLMSMLCWQLLTVLWSHQNVMLAIVGLRGVLVAAAALIISIYFFGRLGVERAAASMYRMAGIWLVMLSGVAVLQLVLGPSHPFNQLAAGLGGDERNGIGDYTAGDFGLEGIFRPTSIFLHTGKFGQVAFVLASYSLFYRHAIGITGPRATTRTVGELAILIMSGQRAAILAYLVAVGALYWISGGTVRRVVSMLVMAAIGFAVWIHGGAGVAGDGVGDLILARIWSGVSELPSRIDDNVLTPIGAVGEQFGLLGAGAGAFSLGSYAWGGKPLYEVVPVGTAENAWLRTWAEIGLPGLLLVAGAIGALILAGVSALRWWTAERARISPAARMLIGFCMYLLVVISGWSNTHDVMGSTTTMAIAFSYCGVLFSRPSRNVEVPNRIDTSGTVRGWSWQGSRLGTA